MLDVVYVLGVIVLFAIVALVAKGVERLGPRAGGSGQSGAMGGGERVGPRAGGSGQSGAMGGGERG